MILIAFVRNKKNSALDNKNKFLVRITTIEFEDEILNLVKFFGDKQRTTNWAIRKKNIITKKTASGAL